MSILHMVGARPRGGGLSVGTGPTFGDAVDRTVYTATGLGPVAADERGVIAIGARQSSTRTLLSVTIGGQPCEELHHVDNAGTTAALWIGPLGATGDVVVTWSASQARCMVGLWPVKGIKSNAPYEVGGSIVGPMTDTIACPAGGAVFAVAYNNNTDVATWGGLLSNQFNQVTESARLTGRANNADGNVTVSCDFPTESNPALCLVSLGPYEPIPPALYATNFGGYAVGAQPSDWTSRWVASGFTALVQAVAGSISGKALRITKTASTRRGISWDAVPASVDVETLMRFRRIESGSSGENIIGVIIRGSGAAGAENGYRGTAGVQTTSTDWTHTYNRYAAGSNVVIGSQIFGPSPALANNEWAYLRFRLVGARLSRKVWHANAAEPAAWAEENIEGGLMTAGWVGYSDTAPNPNAEIDYFAASVRVAHGEAPATIPVPA